MDRLTFKKMFLLSKKARCSSQTLHMIGIKQWQLSKASVNSIQLIFQFYLPSIHQSIFFSFFLSLYRPIYPHLFLSYLSFSCPIFLSVYLSICLSVYLSTYLSIYLIQVLCQRFESMCLQKKEMGVKNSTS